MKPPRNFTEIIDQKRYSTLTAELLAGNDYWDGSKFERSGRNCFLYRRPEGAYFAVNLTQWKGECDSIDPLNQDRAIELFERMTEKRVTFEQVFPGVTVQGV